MIFISLLFFIYLYIYIGFSGAGSQSGENQDEEYNEERKKNDTNYNKGTKILFPKETARLLRLPSRPLPLPPFPPSPGETPL